MTLQSPNNTPINEILQLADRLGFSFLPLWPVESGQCCCFNRGACASPGKHPCSRLVPNGVRNASRDPAVIREWHRQYPTCNWGIATGLQIGDGRYLLVLDQDLHRESEDGAETLAALTARHGELPDTVRAITGGSGQHYFFASTEPVAGRTVGPGLDLKGIGGYVVCAPSVHKSGSPYLWDLGAHPSETDIAAAPAWLCTGSETSGPRPLVSSGRTAADTLLGEAFRVAGFLGNTLQNGSVVVRCPWFAEHTTGAEYDTSTVILPPIDGTNFGSFCCKHSHCNARKYMEVLKVLPPEAVLAAQQKYPLRPQVAIETVSPDAIIPAPNPAQLVLPLLACRQLKGGGLAILADPVNVNAVLSYDTRWLTDEGLPIVQFDEFRQQIRVTAEPPWHPDDKPALPSDYWDADDDTTRLASFLRRTYDVTMSKEVCYSGMVIVAKRNAINPVRDFLRSLKWDGVRRVDTWLAKYLGVTDNPYSRLVGRWWLISGVARIMDPGCKVDTLIILEGGQGIGKSTALRYMAMKDEWFSDSPIEIGSKDAFISLRGKWILEMAELDSLSRAASERNKAFVTSPIDTYRQPYGREATSIPRQCIFAGTTNQGRDVGYFKDQTGNRRYLPVECGAIDLPALLAIREQLWAEAVSFYDSGAKWYPTSEVERQLCETEQEERQETHGDAWDQAIATWLKTPECAALYNEQGFITVPDISARALEMEMSRTDRTAQIRIGRAMTRLGWKRSKRRIEGAPVTAYVNDRVS